ncbi:hypothetical protein GEMRC1_005885 [Eukaryota sp. GEM-RC1]
MLLSPSQWESMTQWKPLAVFFLLAYLFSAICWIAAAYVPSEDLGPVIMLLGVLGPMLAAYIVSKKTQTTSEFWRSTFHYKLHYKWYVAGVGVPLVVLSILLLICYTIGDNINTDEVLPLWTFPLIFLFMALIGGGMEEPGWRGFAQIRLLAHFNPLLASVILGIAWTCWHIPLALIPTSFQAQFSIVDWLVFYPMAVCSLAVILTWMWLKTEGSAFLAIVFHAAVNAINNYTPVFTVRIFGFTVSNFAIGETLWLIVACVVLVLHWQLFLTMWKPPLVQSNKMSGYDMGNVV